MTLDAGSADFRMRLKNRSQLYNAAWSGLLSCDLKTEVDFRLPRKADFDMRL
jgi:hypothetical protein